MNGGEVSIGKKNKSREFPRVVLEKINTNHKGLVREKEKKSQRKTDEDGKSQKERRQIYMYQCTN